jgi:hypothetical protein
MATDTSEAGKEGEEEEPAAESDANVAAPEAKDVEEPQQPAPDSGVEEGSKQAVSGERAL